MTRVELERIGAFADEAEYWDAIDPRLKRLRSALYPFLGTLTRLVGPWELEVGIKYLINEEIELMGQFKEMLEGRAEKNRRADRFTAYKTNQIVWLRNNLKESKA